MFVWALNKVSASLLKKEVFALIARRASAAAILIDFVFLCVPARQIAKMSIHIGTR